MRQALRDTLLERLAGIGLHVDNAATDQDRLRGKQSGCRCDGHRLLPDDLIEPFAQRRRLPGRRKQLGNRDIVVCREFDKRCP